MEPEKEFKIPNKKEYWIESGSRNWFHATDVDYCQDTISFKTSEGKEVVIRGNFIVEES